MPVQTFFSFRLLSVQVWTSQNTVNLPTLSNLTVTATQKPSSLCQKLVNWPARSKVSYNLSNKFHHMPCAVISVHL